MEQGFDKEIDSLLRRGRGGAGARATAGGNGGGAAQAHLDADELSAYAEGALPSAARVAAATHLADCAECRGAVVGLVRAGGVEAALEKSPAAEPLPSRETKPRTSWLDRLGGLFAPRVLRFVVPVLAVCLLGALAFVALRSRPGGPELTRDVQKENAAARVGITAPDEAPRGQQPVDPNASPGQSSSANTNTAAKDAAPSAVTPGAAGPVVGNAADAAPAPAPAPVVSEVTVTPSTAAPQPAQGTAGGAGAGAPPPPPKNEPADEDRAAKAAGAGQSREEVTVVGNAQQQNRAGNAQTNTFEVQSPDGSRAARRAPAPRSAAPAADDAERAEEREDSNREKRRAGESRRQRALSRPGAESDSVGDRPVADERNVGGRRFRREGGAWVDAGYRSSMSSTGVRRGTDAYRALVADHPEVDRAAQQLSGEFVIVIRGRAYRVKP